MRFLYCVLVFFAGLGLGPVAAADWTYSFGVLNKEIELDGRYTSNFLAQNGADIYISETYTGISLSAQRKLGENDFAITLTNFGQDEVERDDVAVAFTRPLSSNLAVSVGAFKTTTQVLDAINQGQGCVGICTNDIDIESTNGFLQFQYQTPLTDNLFFAGKIGYMIGSHDLGGSSAGSYVFSGDSDGGAFGLSLIRPTLSGSLIVFSYEENHLEYEGDANNFAEESYTGFKVSLARQF